MVLRPLEKFFRLPRFDRALLVRTALWLGVARLALWVLPFKVIRRLMSRRARATQRGAATPERITWAVDVARKVVPRADCLPQALVAEMLLLRSGHQVDFRIGVIKTEKGRLEAHAWVESGGRVVVGELVQGLSQYTPMPPLPDVRA